MPVISEIYALALQYHQAGHLPQAEQLYRQILQVNPTHADTHHLLGVLDYQRGRPDQAVDSIRYALSLNPSAATYYCNLGLAYQALNKPEDAIAAYQEVLRLQPQSAEAHCVLGNLLRITGKPAEAVQHCRQALTLQPGFAGAHNNMGLALAEQRQLEEAVNHYQLAVRFDPNYAAAYSNLGLVLVELGRLNDAVASYQQALRINPGLAEAHNGLGMALDRLNRLDDAVYCYQQALRHKPNFPGAWNNMGIVLLRQGRSEDARNCFHQALQCKPDHVDALNNLATVLMEQGKLDEAVTSYRQALAVNPDYAEGYSNLGSVLQSQHKLDEAVDCFKQALRLKPDFAQAFNNLGGVFLRQGRLGEALTAFHEALRLQPDMTSVKSSLLFCLNYDPDADPDAVFEEHRAWGEKCPRPVPTGSLTSNIGHRTSDVLRVGYVSPDLRFHPLTRYLEPVLANHDPERIEVFCYADGRSADAVTARLQNLVPHWCCTGRLSDSAVAERIREDKIDILVDLAGHTANNRLLVFTQKPAPVQVTWLGYMNTTGLPAIDYRLTDAVLDPSDQPKRDTEELVRLASGLCCFAPPEDAPAVNRLPALSKGHLTFGSLHGLLKLNARIFDLWAQVLQALPDSRLLMFHDTVVGTAQDRIRRQFAERGIAGERLDLRQGSCAPGYLAVYQEIDVSLDSFPWTGGVTTCESLWMGVPVLSLTGVRPASRNSASLLARVGLTDWATSSRDEYVAFAKRMKDDLDALAHLRMGLRDRMASTLCDGRRFTRELEEAYRTMWQRRRGTRETLRA